MKAIENVFKGTGGQIDMLNTLYGGSVQTTMAVERDEEHVAITLSAPGVKTEAFNVVVEGNKLILYTLFVSPAKQAEETENQRLAVPMFLRVLDIPAFVDADQIEAVHEQGQVRVFLPYKDKEQMHRRIDIKSLF